MRDHTSTLSSSYQARPLYVDRRSIVDITRLSTVRHRARKTDRKKNATRISWNSSAPCRRLQCWYRTTFSGSSYCFLEPDEIPRIYSVTRSVMVVEVRVSCASRLASPLNVSCSLPHPPFVGFQVKSSGAHCRFIESTINYLL